VSEDDEAIRAGIGQRAEQDGLDDREDRGVGADAERERQQRGDRKARLAAEQATRVAKVIEDHRAVRRTGIDAGCLDRLLEW
jgi:hypothetical protein